MKGKISITRSMSNTDNSTPITIEVEDCDSGANFLEIHMTLEDFAKAITGHGYIDCELKTRGLDHVGKVAERSEIVFEIGDYPFETEKQMVYEDALLACPAGWIVVNYFGSRDSIWWEGKKRFARAKIMRWLDRDSLVQL